MLTTRRCFAVMPLLFLGLLTGAGYGTEDPAGSEPGIPFRVRPAVRFDAPGTAVVMWESTQPGPGSVDFGSTRDLGEVVDSSSSSAEHEVVLSGLAPNTVYYYKIAAGPTEQRSYSPTYSFDTALNYALPPSPPASLSTGGLATIAQEILRSTGIGKGYALVLGSASGRLAYEISRQSDLRVVGLDDSPERVARAREALYRRGVYGTRVSLLTVEDFAKLPLTSCMANLIVSEQLLVDGTMPCTADEIARLLKPGGGTVCLVQPIGSHAAAPLLENWKQTGALKAAASRLQGTFTWSTAVRLPVEGGGAWTHQYGTAGNVAGSGDTLGGASSTSDLDVLWVGRPGADFGIDRQPRMPAPLSVNGRLFHQGMDRMIALDAYNGAILWNLEIPDLRRLNLPRDCSNWCADENKIYVAVRDRAWILDAQTGQRTRTLTASPDEGSGLDWGYIGLQGDRLVGSTVKADSVFVAFWGGQAWFDEKKPGPGTAKICSDQLFAYDPATGKRAWTYRKGLVINSTISMADGRVYFVECRHPEVLALPSRRINDPRLWEDQFLVALDTKSGRVLWDKAIDTEDGLLTFYMQATDQTVILTASNTQYFIYAFNPATGNPQWEQVSKWPSADHSGHIQHPVIVGDRYYVEPNIFDLATGEQLPGKIGGRSGCTTYIASSKALIYRGSGRKVSMWSPESGQVTGWTRLRPSCWMSMITAGGLLQVPEGGAGCSCGGWMETSLVFAPRTLLGLGEDGQPLPGTP